MIKKLFRDTFIFGFSVIFGRALSIIILPFYTKVLSPFDFGIIEMVNFFQGIANIIFPLEISLGVARFFPLAEEKEKIGYASTGLWFTFLTYLFFTFFSIIFSQFITKIFFGIKLGNLFYVALLAIGSGGILYFTQNQLRWELKNKLFSISHLFCVIGSTGITLYFLYYLGSGVYGYFWGQFLGNTIGVIICVIFVRGSFKFIFDIKKLKEMLTYSFPLVFSSLSLITTLYIDRFCIKEFRSLWELGLYGVGYKISSISLLVIIGLQGTLTPFIFNFEKEEGTPIILGKIFKFFLALGLNIFLVLSLFSQELVKFLTNVDYHQAYKIIPLLIPSILMFNMYIFTPGLYLKKQTKIIALINGISALGNSLLNFLLVPKSGIWGAAGSTLFTSLLNFYLYYSGGQKYYPIPFEWSRLLKAIGITILLVIIGFLIGENIQYPIIMRLFLKTVLCFLGIFGISYLLIDFHEIKLFFRELKDFIKDIKSFSK